MDFIADISTTHPTYFAKLKLYGDIMAHFLPTYEDRNEFDWQELIVDNISGIESLDSCRINIVYLVNGKKINRNSKSLDPLVSFPNGLLGSHAIFIIIENFIRNSIKHAFNQKSGQNLELVFAINDNSQYKDLIEVIIHDKLRNADANLIEMINLKINKTLLGVDGSLRSDAWGIAEMKI